MTGLGALAGLLGAGTGLGLLIVMLGVRGRPPGAEPRRGVGPRWGRIPWRRAVIVTVTGLFVGVVTRWPAAAVLAAAGAWWLPTLLGPDREHTRRVARIEAIAGWTESLCDTLSAAAGLEQAILATAPLAPTAIAEPVAGLATRLRTGERLPEALHTLGDELADPTADLVVTALVMAASQHARDLSGLLGELARAARDQAAMRLRVATTRARIRSATRIITGATLAMAAGLAIWSRDFLAPYDTPAGQAVLLVIGVVFAFGFAWLHRMARFAEPARVLAPTAGGA